MFVMIHNDREVNRQLPRPRMKVPCSPITAASEQIAGCNPQYRFRRQPRYVQVFFGPSGTCAAVKAGVSFGRFIRRLCLSNQHVDRTAHSKSKCRQRRAPTVAGDNR